jgi:hypothetical protein
MKCKAPCSHCLASTFHDELGCVERRVLEVDPILIKYRLLQCAGCETVCFEQSFVDLSDGSTTVQYYPSPITRKKPAWLNELLMGYSSAKKDDLDMPRYLSKWFSGLLGEIYQAVRGEQYTLG